MGSVEGKAVKTGYRGERTGAGEGLETSFLGEQVVGGEPPASPSVKCLHPRKECLAA